MYTLYKITNTINGKSYIGITKLSITERWKRHVSKTQSPKYPLYFAMAKYGIEVFTIEHLESSEDRNYISSLEEPTIQQLKTHITQHGYNVAKGGYGGNLGAEAQSKRLDTIRNYSPEQRIQWKNNLRNSHLGSKRSLETKLKMSKLQKDCGGYGPKKHSSLTKEKISNSNKGKTRSDLARQRYSAHAKLRGVGPQLSGKKIGCICCHKEWDLGNFTQHINRSKHVIQ